MFSEGQSIYREKWFGYSLPSVILIFSLILPIVSYAEPSAYLSEDELRWLVDHPEIRLAPDPQFLPIEHFDGNGKYVGIAADYISLIEKKLDVQFHKVHLENWDSVLKQSRNREVDLWGAATPTPQREAYMNFTRPFLELPAVILVRKRVTDDLSLKTLRGMKVAVISGYGIHDHILNEYPEIELDTVPDIRTGLKKVSMGMADALVTNIALATTYIEKEGITNLRIAGESGFVYRWALASRNDWPELSRILDKTLTQISPAERQAIYRKWVTLPASGKPLKEIGISLAVILGLLGIAGIIFWNRSLSQQVKLRTHELNEELEERRRIESALRESEQKFKQLFSQLKFIVQGTSTATGEEFFKSLAYYLSHALNVKYAFVGELQDPEMGLVKTLAFWTGSGYSDNLTYEIAHTPCEKVMEGGWASFSEGVKERFPEDQFLLSLGIEAYQGIPIKDHSGKVLGHLGVMDDKPIMDAPINQMILSIFASRAFAEMERMNAEGKLVSARDKAEKANKAKSDFLSRMSHELRTPLNAILGFGQLMQHKADVLNERHKECVEQILRSGNHLLELINEVLDLSQIESSRQALKIEAVHVSSIIQKAVALVNPLAWEREIKIINNIPDDSRVHVDADSLRLYQVLINLISNAIKYNREQGTVTLDVVFLTNDRCRIEVKDTGKGIPEDQSHKIFEPFERLGAEYSEELGTGIGLTICQSLIQQMGGSIQVDSVFGAGSCFSIELPVPSESPPSISLAARPKEMS